ncbi:restriction endonuclease subunit S [Bradyrhizobium septentrionale]|uniref:Restriction endonuclease subunit S n=1 Tax=Bradyrhizobium septentrionale TaxID=1404411 RepID=A0A974A4Z1_9BRAD|nr:restriction endonuclease subunit S [Bradyrhizobium septentrionale]UGY18604.1 restriction endonuclease subunit S [Bradyrhizobium septentrionale]
MSSEVPKGWLPAKLGEIAALSGGTTPSKSNGAYWTHGTVPWATPSDVTSLPLGQTRIATTEAQVSERALKECSLKLNPPNTVLMTSRATIGYAVINDMPMATNQGFLNFACSSDCVPEFLCHWLNAKRDLLTAAAGGSTFKELSRGTAKLLPILLPPVDEQRRIAEVLRSVDEAILANRASIMHMSRVRAATLHAAFEESAWEPVKLGDLGRWSSGGTPPKADQSLWNGDVPWICPRDMKSPVVTRAESTVAEKAIGGACKMVPNGTLLLVVRGMILAKAIPTATTAMAATYNQDIKAFHPNGRAIPKFVQLCLQHQEHGLLKQVNTATHGTKKLDAHTIAEVEVPLPDLPTQIELSQTITDMDLAMVRSGEEHIRLVRMKAALQSDLLFGHVRVPA